MKKRLKEMEEEAAALREMQAKVEKEMGAVQGIFVFRCRFEVGVGNWNQSMRSCCLVYGVNFHSYRIRIEEM